MKQAFVILFIPRLTPGVHIWRVSVVISVATLAARFNASSFAFNPLLCGMPLNTTGQHRHYEHQHHRHGNRAILLIPITVAYGALFLVSATAW